MCNCAYICVLLKYIHSTSELESPVLTIQSWQKVWPSVFSECTADCMRLITQAASQCVACSRAAVELSVAARHPPFGPRSLLHLHHLLVHHLQHLLGLHHHSLHHQQQQKGNHHHHQNNNNKYLPSFSEIILITSHPPLREATPEKKHPFFWALPELGDQPAQIDVDTLYFWSKNKNKEVAQIECRGEG